MRELRKRTWVFLGMAVVLGGAVTAVVVTAGGPAGTSSKYVPVAEGEVTATAGAAGNLQSADSRDLAFGSSGTVEKVYVKVGEKVTEGDRLARMDQTKAKEDLASAKAALAAAEAAADGTDATVSGASYTTATDDTVVAPAGYTPSDTTPSRTATRTPSPTPPPSSSPSPSPTASPTRSSTPTRPSTAPRSSVPRPPSTRPSATTSTAQLQAKVTEAENNVAKAQQALDATVIKAPIDGTVIAINGQAGDTATQSSAFITIGDLSELQMLATFSQNDVARLRIGQQAKITLSADPATSYSGTVSHIDANATVSDNLVRYGVQVAFDDAPSKVLIGQSGTVTVTTSSSQADTLYVPSSAVRPGPNGTYTVRVYRGNTTVTRTVTIGVRGDAYTEIKSGLAKGERVATSG